MFLAVRKAARSGKLSGAEARPLYLILALLVLWAPVSAWLAIEGAYTSPQVLALNAYGFLIIVPWGLVLMNLGIPGPWHVIHSTPDMVSMFEYPMALAPTVVVPVFVVVNAFIVSYVKGKAS